MRNIWISDFEYLYLMMNRISSLLMLSSINIHLFLGILSKFE